MNNNFINLKQKLNRKKSSQQTSKAFMLIGLIISIFIVTNTQSAKAVCSSTGSLGRAEINFNVASGEAGPHSIWIEAKGPAGARVAAGVNSNICTTATLNMTSTFAWYKVNTADLPAVSAGNGQTLNISVYTPGVSIRGARIDTTVPDTPPPVNDLPVVTLQSSTTTNPTALANYKITATATDSNGIASVEFFENNVLVLRDTTFPYEFNAINKAAGTYNYTAVATDYNLPSGKSTSAVRTVIVNPAPSNLPPVVPVPTASTTNARLGTNGIVSIRFATKPTDSDGSIRNVDFLRNGQYASTGLASTTGEYTASIEFTTTGSFTIAARATDDKGSTTTSGNITVNITNNTDTPTTSVLTQQIYDGTNLTNLKATQPADNINNIWEYTAPSSLVNIDNFSSRWTGKITAPVTGTYTFTTFVDDGVRLWVNNQLLVDDWNNGSAREKSGTISLISGTSYDIKMEYYEAGGRATAQLFWTIPNTALKQIIPASAFKSGTTNPVAIQPPSNLRVTKAAFEWFDCKIYLAWTPPADVSNLASYRVQANNSPEQTTLVNSWKQNGVSCGYQINTFKVSSVDKQGKVSLPVSVTVKTDCPWFTCKIL